MATLDGESALLSKQSRPVVQQPRSDAMRTSIVAHCQGEARAASAFDRKAERKTDARIVFDARQAPRA